MSRWRGSGARASQQKLDLGLSVRATPAPLPPPRTPARFQTVLNGAGSLTVTRKYANPPASRDTCYQVWRSLDGIGRVNLGVAGEKLFVDRTLPAGATGLIYHLQAARTTKAGLWAQFSVSFGVGSGATVTKLQTATKIAA